MKWCVLFSTLVMASSDPLVPPTTEDISWSTGKWLNVPQSSNVNNGTLEVVTKENTDFWRLTSYGFVHDNGHAFLVDFPPESAFEVTYQANFEQQFDQAGIMVRVDEKNWVKAGVEYFDGLPHVSAVVTRDYSDWSPAEAPGWNVVPVTVRVSRTEDALTLRARLDQADHWNLLRVVPLDRKLNAKVGPFTCSPTRAGLQVRFTRLAKGPVDIGLHPNSTAS